MVGPYPLATMLQGIAVQFGMLIVGADSKLSHRAD